MQTLKQRLGGWLIARLPLNHLFVQDCEHYGGFGNVETATWRQGNFPGGCLDREQHRLYAIYKEARR